MKLLCLQSIACWIVFSDALLKTRSKRSVLSDVCESCYRAVDDLCLADPAVPADTAHEDCYQAHRDARAAGDATFQYQALTNKFRLRDSKAFFICESDSWEYENIADCEQCEQMVYEPKNSEKADSDLEWDMWVDCCVKVYGDRNIQRKCNNLLGLSYRND